MMNEREAYGDWVKTVNGRVTGWMAWRASLDARGIRSGRTRPAFEAWLLEARKEGWHLIDAWEAAAAWAAKR